MLGGTGAGAGGSAGLGNPSAGTGGSSGSGGAAAGEGGSGGAEPIGGAAGTGAGGTGGFAGMASGGTGGGAGGTASDPDAGASDGGDPPLECEEGRETLELDVIALSMNVPRCVARSAGQGELVALAVTPHESPLGGAAETIWPKRTEGCADPLGFSATTDWLPGLSIELCSELCESILQDGAGAYELELIYGCEPPE